MATEADVMARSRQKKKRQGPAPSAKQRMDRHFSMKSCACCGASPHKRSSCPARNSKFFTCDRHGHFARVCQSKSRSNAVSALTRDSDARFLGASSSTREGRKIYAQVGVNGEVMWAKNDAGAEVSAFPADPAGVQGTLQSSNQRLQGPAGNSSMSSRNS